MDIASLNSEILDEVGHEKFEETEESESEEILPSAVSAQFLSSHLMKSPVSDLCSFQLSHDPGIQALQSH